MAASGASEMQQNSTGPSAWLQNATAHSLRMGCRQLAILTYWLPLTAASWQLQQSSRLLACALTTGTEQGGPLTGGPRSGGSWSGVCWAVS